MIASIEPPFMPSVLPGWFLDRVGELIGGRHLAPEWMAERLTKTFCQHDPDAARPMIPVEHVGTLYELGGEAVAYRTPWTHTCEGFCFWWARFVWPLAGIDGTWARWFDCRAIRIGEQLPAGMFLNDRPIPEGVILEHDATRHIRRDGKLLLFRIEFVLRRDVVRTNRFWHRQLAFEDQLAASVTSLSHGASGRGKREARASQKTLGFDGGSDFKRWGPYQ